MTETPSSPGDGDDRQVDEIVGRGPSGAFAVAGVATAIVVVLYVLFYLVVYLPRGAVQ
ncbi:hypothetical protein ACPWT1_10060 [Ramlibacter sp. MMS24-I3-19]|uniref:hypothetical protein n=1 Tax=Ramlibacter sp. MMS24-I3-19 TaxID=3416606 RepID=UPI003D0414DE